MQARKHDHSTKASRGYFHTLSASFGKLIVRLRDAKPRMLSKKRD